MILYLRNENNADLFEVEFWESDDVINLHSHIYSDNCFKYILKNIDDKKYIEAFIEEFKFLEEIRGWYFETYRHSKNPQDFTGLIYKLREILAKIASRLNLKIIED